MVVVVFVGRRSVSVLRISRVFDVIYVRTIRSDLFASTIAGSVLAKTRITESLSLSTVMVITAASVTLGLLGTSAKSAFLQLIPSQVLTCALISFQTVCAIQGL